MDPQVKSAIFGFYSGMALVDSSYLLSGKKEARRRRLIRMAIR